MPGRPVAPRANLIAASTHSAPELAKNTLSRYGTYFEQPLGQHAGERRDVELHEIGQVASSTLFSAVAHRRMIAADREHAKAAQEIEIAGAVAIEEVLALPLLEADIVADGLEDPNELLVQMPGMQELRWAWRSANNSEMSGFGYSIRYILRLMAVSSTENARMRPFALIRTIFASTGLDHVALPRKHHAY